MKGVCAGALVLLALLGGCSDKKGPSVGASIDALDRCDHDLDCAMVREDSCCLPSECEEDARPEALKRTKARRDACKIKDCGPKKRTTCTPPTRSTAGCKGGRCVKLQ